MSFGKLFRHEVHVLLFMDWFIIQKLAKGLEVVDCKGSIVWKFYIASEGKWSHPIAIVIWKTVGFDGATRLIIIPCSLKDVTADPIVVGTVVTGSPEELT